MARSRRIQSRPEQRLGRGAASRPRPEREAQPEGGLSRLVRRVLGIRRDVGVSGVVYREARARPLDRALASKKHYGKRYRVAFPDGRSLTITATRERRFADLMDVPELRSLGLAGDLIRPGSRVLVLGGGTGGLAAMSAAWTGPDGAVVSLEHDAESVRYARRRYPLPSVSFERGGAESLGGEIDGSFDAVVVVGQPLGRADAQTGSDPEEEARIGPLAEAWRVVRPGGRLLAIGGLPPEHAEKPGEASQAGRGEVSLKAYFGFDPGPAKVAKRLGADSAPALLVIEKPEGPGPARS